MLLRAANVLNGNTVSQYEGIYKLGRFPAGCLGAYRGIYVDRNFAKRSRRCWCYDVILNDQIESIIEFYEKP